MKAILKRLLRHPPIATRSELAYADYRSERDRGGRADFSWLTVPCEPGLVSVILPVYNGADYIRESVQSILAQTYRNLELVVVDDGSTDATPEILRQYASRDSRVRIVRQENQKLPAALSNGHRQSRGEWLTWTSDDNRMHPRFIETLLQPFRTDPALDYVYTDYQLIDESGNPLRNAEFCAAIQQPPGSGRIVAPSNPYDMLYYSGNFMGAAFLYRRRVWSVLGDYGRRMFTAEDYDYFLRALEVFRVRKLEGPELLYEYRIHSATLSTTAGHDRIRRTAARCFGESLRRREQIRIPLVWFFAGMDTLAPPSRSAVDRLRRRLREQGDEIRSYEQAGAEALRAVAPHAVIVNLSGAELPEPPAPALILRLTPQAAGFTVGLESEFHCGEFTVDGLDPLIAAIRAVEVNHWYLVREEVLHAGRSRDRALSLVVCTNRGARQLEPLLASLGNQRGIRPAQWELIVVDNGLDSPDRAALARLLDAMPCAARVVDGPLAGLSHARNAGIGDARGTWVCFLDDDTVCDPGMLEGILRIGGQYEDLGLIGGAVEVVPPETPPRWYGPVLAPYFSGFSPPAAGITFTESFPEFPYGALWVARGDLLCFGTFSARYGRGGLRAGAAEEMAAAVQILHAGKRIGTTRDIRVEHHVAHERFAPGPLLRAMRQAWLGRWQLEQDGYLPYKFNLPGSVRYTLRHGLRALNPAISAENRMQAACQAYGSACVVPRLCVALGKRLGLRLRRN